MGKSKESESFIRKTVKGSGKTVKVGNELNFNKWIVKKLRGRTITSEVKSNGKRSSRKTMDSYVKKVDALELDGNISEKWRVFKQNFDIFATAIELSKKSESVQIAVFLN